MRVEEPASADEEVFDYDVAFSFLKDDERLAVQLNELLNDRLNTFLYSKRQEDLAGRDGEEEFNRVFGRDARIVVVFYRRGWGDTPWTRIEETAIRNRAYDSGYDFTLFIPLDSPPAPPQWLPRTQLWFGIERWGIKGAAAVVERLVQQRGGSVRQQTIEDEAARFVREREAEARRQALRDSEEGVARADAGVEALFAELEAFVESGSQGLGMSIARERRGRALYLSSNSLVCVWDSHVLNSIERARLVVTLCSGNADFGGRHFVGSSRQQSQRDYKPDFDLEGNLVWRLGGRGDSMSTKQLMDALIRTLLDRARARRA